MCLLLKYSGNLSAFRKRIAQASGDPHCQIVVLRVGLKVSKPYMFSNSNANTDKIKPVFAFGSDLLSTVYLCGLFF